MTEGIFNILLVEDDPADAALALRALGQSKAPTKVYLAKDGDECLRFLRRQGPDFEQVPRPSLILLDLNMPRISGHEVLAAVKEDETLRNIPIVVLTTSDFEHDVVRSYNLGANSFITKPVDVEQFISLIRAVENYWLHLVSLP